jgi:hypothetical protein
MDPMKAFVLAVLIFGLEGSLLWLLATKFKPVATSDVWRPILKVLGTFIGIGMPTMGVLVYFILLSQQT